jgi:hypothetical protein
MHKLCQARGPQENTISRKRRKTTPDEKTSVNTMKFNGYGAETTKAKVVLLTPDRSYSYRSKPVGSFSGQACLEKERPSLPGFQTAETQLVENWPPLT